MENKKLQEAIEITSGMLHSFYCIRNKEKIFSYIAEDAVWIGPGDQKICLTKADLFDYYEKAKEDIPLCDILNQKYAVTDYGQCCMVYGKLSLRSKEESKLLIEVNQWISFFFQEVLGKLEVKHMHLSNIEEEQADENLFPKRMGAQSYGYLQEMLKEKTEVIEMITANINGGLKSSNDDEIYSHFYVNEGLPKMLGYTYDEFMEKTNNCAIDAVYPPDLPKALLSVSKQLENKMFSIEYRMEKKDGSLIWVLESGNKSPDGKGGYKINSILMDITPLKTAQFELELERERYRFALENITDVMFEYDIQNDIYVTYQRIEVDGKTELEMCNMPNFSKSFWAKSIVHPSDGDLFLDVLRAEHRGVIEICTRSIQAKGEWRNARISCSVIYNANRQPIRTIGTMKDITEEKKNEDSLLNRLYEDSLTRLLNQMTAKKYIQQYLGQKEIYNQSALLIVNLDNFKTINQAMGNLFGNEILIATSRVLTENIRTEDIVGRISGDDFIILLKQADRGAAALCAKRILEKVSLMGVKQNIKISCSIGIAMTSEAGEDYDRLLEMADRAIYYGKLNGKNQYVFYEEAY